MSDWKGAQEAEGSWWGDCTNTYQEESKQRDYARRLGLREESVDGRWPVYRIGGRGVVDIGGGPISLLLKCIERGICMVVDPCDYPEWVTARYRCAGIRTDRRRGEDFDGRGFDEAWIYNVLQHCEDPERVVRNAFECAPVVRIFEWVGVGTDEMHVASLSASALNEWTGGVGKTEYMSQFNATAYYGTFRR